MGNNAFLSWILVAALALVGAGCQATNLAGSKGNVPAPTPAPLKSSTVSGPVYILPQLQKAWVSPDASSDTWTGGYETATVVSEGRFASLEEAELLGLPYIIPSDGHSVLPPPNPPTSADQLNATTLAQDLAALGRENATSLRNQGSTDQPELTPPSTPVPAPSPANTPTIESTEASDFPQKIPSGDPEAKTTPAEPPRVTYSLATRTIAIFPGGGSGSAFAVPTPMGNAKLTYSESGITIEMRGQKVNVDIPKTEPVIVEMTQFGL